MMAESTDTSQACVHRDRTLLAVQRCDDCAMLFCCDCDCELTHSYICPIHKTEGLSARSRDGTSVDGGLATDDKDENEPRFEFYHEFSTAIPSEDDRVPELRDVLLTDRDFILITDTGNCVIKVFDKDGNFCGEYFVREADEDASGRMHGIAQTEKNKFYVTMPSQRKIVVLHISETEDGEIKFDSVYSYDTTRRYFGIAPWIQKTLLVGSTDTVDVLTHAGDYVKSISESEFKKPFNMTVENSGSVLVCDSRSNAVTRVKVNERIEQLTKFGQNFKLRGLTTDDQGNILVCALNKTGLQRLTKSGIRLGSVQPKGDDLEKPIAIDFKKTESGTWLVVAMEGGIVQVFRVLHH